MRIVCFRPIYEESIDPEQHKRVRVVAKTHISDSGHGKNRENFLKGAEN